MKAMILAAGFGTRLRPLTDRTPKPLLKVGARSLLEWNLLLLRTYGVREVVINLHYLADQIEEAVGCGKRLGMAISYSREPVILGTGGGIKQVESFFEGKPFLVMNGDTLSDVNLGALIQSHLSNKPLATLVLREDPEAERWGPVEVDQGGNVLRINRVGRAEGKASETLMFAGIHILDHRLLQDVPLERESSIVEAYHRELVRGERIAGFRFAGYWSDVGTLERYEQAQRDVSDTKLSLFDRIGRE